MYNEKLEALITAALADGVLTDKEKNLLFKKAEAMGIDLDEFELVLNGRLAKRKKEMEAQATKKNGAIPQELDDLIKEYLSDGIISPKERQVLLNKAQALGLNLDEVDLYIDAQQQKADQAVASAMNKRRGKTCPYCGSSIPELTDKCPNCGGNITPEASKELEEIIEYLENALVSFKSGEDVDKSKAEIERYVRKARMYYGNNPKIQRLVEEVEEESEAAEAAAKKKSLWVNIKNVTSVVVPVVLLLLLLGICFYFSPDSERKRKEEKQEEMLKKLQDAKEQTQSLGNKVLEMINNGDLNGAKNELSIYSIPDAFDSYDIVREFDGMYLALIKAYIERGNFDEAEDVGISFKLKICNDYQWKESSCYQKLKKEFKKKGRDFSALKVGD
ncbi:hypothetical protein [uncultured Prevotella sp.]|uniref:hypothetical protein n=1 Tax=uncultured Prevotella sp. TaxID=159272 RepID=UPI0026279028|nr:hypothetical protein [uncultured Prevotella sp.]